MAVISIHAAREGGDRLTAAIRQLLQVFQSTPPVKAATFSEGTNPCLNIFQSTPPVKAATETLHKQLPRHAISIHAAREGGDAWTNLVTGIANISIHAAREGGDARALTFLQACMIFQSTPPVKAATPLRFLLPDSSTYFNPRRP